MTRRAPGLGRRPVGLAVGLMLAAVACSVEDALPVPDCQTGGSALIVAQSVPTADLVPCFNGIPAGWEVTSVAVGQDGSQVQLDSDRAGEGAARLHYEPSCEVDGAVSVPSDQEGADRFDFIERVDPGFRAQWYYLFEGGCVWWDFDFDDETPAALSVELGETLALFTREFVNQGIRENFIDEEL